MSYTVVCLIMKHLWKRSIVQMLNLQKADKENGQHHPNVCLLFWLHWQRMYPFKKPKCGVCVDDDAGLGSLTWPESDWLDPGAGWGCTPVAHWAINVYRISQPSPHSLRKRSPAWEAGAPAHVALSAILSINRLWTPPMPYVLVWRSLVKVT